MSGGSRPLPIRPNLRYLKLEAKRRLAAGEFSSLHGAQQAIAWEHGLASWGALKQVVSGRAQQESHALPQLKWVITRFRDAGTPGWSPPGDDELRQHFNDHFLTEIPAGELIAAVTKVAADLREEPIVTGQALLQARVEIASLDVFAWVEDDPPHRLTGLRAIPARGRVSDTRTAAPPPPARTLGDVPAEMAATAEEAFTELGAAGLVLAGSGPDAQVWVVAKGWADLGPPEPHDPEAPGGAEALDTGHRFPAPGIAALVTATAVLRLAADGRIGLDSSANDYLRTVRLADDTVTVRELLSHTGGVRGPTELFAEAVPDLVTLVGPVVACESTRGTIRPSNGGYAMLGQLIADVTGSAYTDAVTRLVLEPLGMSGSLFPARSADLGRGAVTSYDVTPEGTFAPVTSMICTIPAVGGLWAPAADVVRLGAGWSSLLPAALAREAVTPQTEPGPSGHRVGLGWLISPRGDIAVHAGAGGGATACLLTRIGGSRVHLTMTNRLVSLDSINDRVLRSWGNTAR